MSNNGSPRPLFNERDRRRRMTRLAIGAAVAAALIALTAYLIWRHHSHGSPPPMRHTTAAVSVSRVKPPARPSHTAGPRPIASPGCPPEREDWAGARAAAIAWAHWKIAHSGFTAAMRSIFDRAIDDTPGREIREAGVLTLRWAVMLPGRAKPSVLVARGQCKCRGWGSLKIPPRPAPPKPRKRSWFRKSFPPPRPVIRERVGNCFAYHVYGLGELPQYAAAQPDGDPYPRITVPMQVELLFYPGGSYTRRMLEADPCFRAVDNVTHAHLRLSHDCSFCAPGDRQLIWPADVADNTETDFMFSIYNADGTVAGCPSGDCTVYVPLGFVASSLWCFATDRYYDQRRWHYEGYSFSVTRRAVEEDLAQGRREYRARIRPLGVFGWNQ